MKPNKIIDISIILPCRNEEKAIGICINSIKNIIKEKKLNAEIIVSDSSTDKSPLIAQRFGAIVITHNKEGYGNAYIEGIKAAKGKYIFMADADCTYDFSEIPKFIYHLKNGYDFVIGNRFGGKMDNDSMPFMHRYIGNPILSATLRLFFNTKIRDSHCGMRAIKREAYDKLNLKTTGMEFASEMIIKVIRNGLKIKEIPINYHKRVGKSKLKSFSDAWKHLRFMLLYSPLFLFFFPGILSFGLGLISMIGFYTAYINKLGFKFDYHPMFVSAMLIIIGYELIIFGIFAKTYLITHLGEKSRLFTKLYRYVTIEKASIVGGIIFFIGGIIFLLIFLKWYFSHFGSLAEIKNGIVALTLITIGIQTIFSSFMLSVLGIK